MHHLYNLVLVAGTAYIVFWMGFSGWWWLLTLGLMLNMNKS